MKGYLLQITGKYKKDYRRCEKRHWDMNLLNNAVEILCRGEKLAEDYDDHSLSGKWAGSRECHIGDDWVLVYRKEDQNLILRRTGSHSDVFGG